MSKRLKEIDLIGWDNLRLLLDLIYDAGSKHEDHYDLKNQVDEYIVNLIKVLETRKEKEMNKDDYESEVNRFVNLIKILETRNQKGGGVDKDDYYESEMNRLHVQQHVNDCRCGYGGHSKANCPYRQQDAFKDDCPCDVNPCLVKEAEKETNQITSEQFYERFVEELKKQPDAGGHVPFYSTQAVLEAARKAAGLE